MFIDMHHLHTHPHPHLNHVSPGHHHGVTTPFPAAAADPTNVVAHALLPRTVGGDNGKVLNSSEIDPFIYGLNGVNQVANYLFVNALIISFAGLMLVTLCYRWAHMGTAHARHLFTMNRDSDQRYWMYNRSRLWPRLKKNLFLAPLGRVRHNREIQLSKVITVGTLPSRFHSLLLFVYLASNMAYCLVLDWDRSQSASIVAELRGRSGVLAAINLIPTVLFALRNNPLIPLLKVSYDTFNLLHRWCARMMVLESIIHTLCWAVNNLSAGGLAQLDLSLSTSLSYQGGMVATSVFVFITLAAFGPVRHAFYETFLFSHRALVMVGLIGTYVHLAAANLPALPYVQLALILWVLEWVWRAGRLFRHNLSRQRGITRITVVALPSEACRVTFELSRPWRWTPGCHVHAYLPTVALWSSHPFSVAWAENLVRDDGDGSVLFGADTIEMEKLARPQPGFAAMATSKGARASVLSLRGVPATTAASGTMRLEGEHGIVLPSDADATTVSLVVRARTGMTRALFRKAAAAPGGSFTTWGAIEGPYGGHHSLASYGTVLLFAGGVGITHCLGYVYHLIRQYELGLCSTRRILLVWSVPNTEALAWIHAYMDQILRMDGRRDILRIQLFVTKPRHRGEVVSNTGSVQMFPGRCNPQAVIDKEMPDRVGAVGIMVCGPGSFADSVRSAARSVVEQGSVEFIEEAFTY